VEATVALLLPFTLVLARTAAFFSALPVFSHAAVPMQVRAGVAVVLSLFLAALVPAPAPDAASLRLLGAAVLVAREVLCGLALGLAARLVFLAIEQGGLFIAREMGFATSFIIDPSTGEETDPLGVFLDALFVLLFLAAGGHHLLVRLIARSYEVVPAGGAVRWDMLASAVTAAGSQMLLLMLKLAAPVLAAFLVLAVVLGVLARVLPELDILLTSLPVRVAAGLFVAGAMVPVLRSFTDEITQWIGRLI